MGWTTLPNASLVSTKGQALVDSRWRVAVTQPYIPDYRVPLFDELVKLLEAESVSVRFFTGGDRDQLWQRDLRGDASTAPRWSERVVTRTFRFPTTPLKLQYRYVPRVWRDADLLITELQAGNANAWERWMTREPYVLLGHGAPYTSGPNRISQMMEARLNQRAAHVLTYVPSGRSYVLKDTRIAPSKVTAFMNTTDTDLLTQLASSASVADIAVFRTSLGVPPSGSIALYAGSLTSEKRIGFLCAAAEDVLSDDADAYLLIAGDGPERHLVEELRAHYGRVSLLGQTDAAGLALAGRAATALLNPGRIGLVAVDALALQLPVLSTRYEFHAPEAEYLEEGKTVFYSENTVQDFARLWRQALAGDITFTSSSWIPSIEHSAGVIAQAIMDTLDEKALTR